MGLGDSSHPQTAKSCAASVSPTKHLALIWKTGFACTSSSTSSRVHYIQRQGLGRRRWWWNKMVNFFCLGLKLAGSQVAELVTTFAKVSILAGWVGHMRALNVYRGRGRHFFLTPRSSIGQRMCLQEREGERRSRFSP